ncbi:hypothetical protein BG261_07340 [Floricoccus tropicus]|uniref:DUF1694 domain-containing protein n=1 Tax=Floricoccus tropicus TaxID=1859473 RepID=A0A1E8GKC5_9LACT|nr:YueI family protein [Floricoccus tropicus]OFI48699.1 hypothetical protein BG261_07340 [Floricoccus tropicus]
METNLKNRIDMAANGEHRFNPDEQRKYLNTFRERVILIITYDDCMKKEVLSSFDKILEDIQSKYDDITVKINGTLPDDISMAYVKKAKDHNAAVTIVAEPWESTVFGIIIHSSKAVNIEHCDIYDQYKDILTTRETIKKKKESLWKKIFG